MDGKAPAGIFSNGLLDNIFDNASDLSVKSILDRLIDIMSTDGGIAIDSTAETDLQVVDAGSGKVNIKAGVAYDKFGQRIVISADDSASGIVTGSVDLSSDVDLSVNHLIKIDIDNIGSIEIDCTANAVAPATTTIDEILAEINTAGFGTIAFRSDVGGNPITTGAYITIKSSTTGGSSEVEFVAPSATDATNEIFGLDEGAYPHTFVGGGGYQIPDDSTSYDVIIEYLSVNSVVGNFAGGFPTGSDPQYTQRDDSYAITIQLSSVGAINDTNQHELLLAQVSNTGGTLTLTEKRDLIFLRLKGVKQVDDTPPPAPTVVSLNTSVPTTGVSLNQGYIIPRWNSVTDPSGIREYIIRLTLTEESGTAVANAFPEEIAIQGFDSTLSELETSILRPLGNRYTVEVAAKDNSLGQNISPFTGFGSILVGGTDGDTENGGAVIRMPQITLTPAENSVFVDWPDINIDILGYEYAFTLNGAQPQFSGAIYETPNSEFTIQAAPGTKVQVRVRARLLNQNVTADISGDALAGGVLIGNNEKVISRDGMVVVNTSEGVAARFLGRRYLPNPATVARLVVNVLSLALNSAERGVIRVYRENAEDDAAIITFLTTGPVELAISQDLTAGQLIIDAFDTNETGVDQAAYTADLDIVYIEGQVQAPVTSGTEAANTGL